MPSPTGLFWLLWLSSLLAATFLGYDKGRWFSGLALGLLFGPVGVVAAGFLPASFEWEARRRYDIEKSMRGLRCDDEERARELRQNRQSFDELIGALEEQFAAQRMTFAEGLDQLARDLREVSDSDPRRAQRLRHWVGWLSRQSQHVRQQAPVDVE